MVVFSQGIENVENYIISVNIFYRSQQHFYHNVIEPYLRALRRFFENLISIRSFSFFMSKHSHAGFSKFIQA